MAYRPSSPEEKQYIQDFNLHYREIRAYKDRYGGSLEDAYQAITGRPWMKGRSVKDVGGPGNTGTGYDMTKDRTVKSVLGKYVAPIAGGAAAAFGFPGLFPGLLSSGGAGGATTAATTAAATGGMPALSAPAAWLPPGTPGLLGTAGAATIPPAVGEAAKVGGAAGAGAAAKNLWGIPRDLLVGGGLSALGGLLENLSSKPLFQERKGFTGAAAPQRLAEGQIGRLNELYPQLQQRAFAPVNAGDEVEEVRKTLQGLL